MVRDYGQQGEMLEQHFAELALDRFLAPLELTFDRAQPKTWTSWAQEARAVLPKADAVVLIDAQGQSLPRLWEDVEAICGSFSPQGATYPQRHDGQLWPSPEVWRRLSETTTAPAWLSAAL